MSFHLLLLVHLAHLVQPQKTKVSKYLKMLLPYERSYLVVGKFIINIFCRRVTHYLCEKIVLEDFHLSSSSTPSKIWIKYGDSRPVRLTFDGEIVDDLIRAIKKELPNQLDSIDVNQINLRRHGEEADLDPELAVDQSFENNSNIPLQVIVNVPGMYRERGDN